MIAKLHINFRKTFCFLLALLCLASLSTPIYASADKRIMPQNITPIESEEGLGYNDLIFNTIDVGELPIFFTYRILQDKNGLMWFATDSGLFVYDGVRLTQTESKTDTESYSLANNFNRIAQDVNGRIWAASRYGGASLLVCVEISDCF